MGHHHHHDIPEPTVAVCTISSSRTLADDPAGDAIETSLEAAGATVATRESITDATDTIRSTVESLCARSAVDAVVTTGGTGVTPDDCTIEALSPLFDKELPGFGELFRQRSIDQIGTRVIATRATAGIVDETVVCCLPGSEDAARLGASELVAPELSHLAGLAQRS